MADEAFVDGNESINGYSFTVEWLLRSLRDNDEEFQKNYGNKKVQKFTAYDVSKGKGFASEILRCCLTFDDSPTPYTTVLKIPGLASYKEALTSSNVDFEVPELFQKLSDVHNNECDFYDNLAPILLGPIPKVYQTIPWVLGQNQGCIHMEDLTTKGKTLTYFESVNLSQVKAMIRALAKMHKNILSADEELWKGKYLAYQTVHIDHLDMIKPLREAFLDTSNRRADLELYLKKYEKLAASHEYYRYVQTEVYQPLAPVIVHGDMFSGNIMWSIDSKGEIQNDLAAIVDWQIVHEGSPMSDLAHFLTRCADGVVRRQAEVFAIDYYLQCLTEEFNGDASKVPYTAEDLKRQYQLYFIIHAFALSGISVFFLAAIEHEIQNQAIKDAYIDAAVLKALHALEDVDLILQKDLKDIETKFNR